MHTRGTKYQEIIIVRNYAYNICIHINYTYIGVGYPSVFNCCAPFVDMNSSLRFIVRFLLCNSGVSVVQSQSNYNRVILRKKIIPHSANINVILGDRWTTCFECFSFILLES